MKRLYPILLSLLVIQVVLAQHKKSVDKFSVICQLRTSSGKYLGTVLGKAIRDSLYSDIIVIRKTEKTVDTLYKILKDGLYDPDGWGDDLIGKYYDGYGFELDKSDGFIYWMRKINVTSGDGRTVVWNYSKKIFEELVVP